MRLLRAENEALCLENETQRRKNEELSLENETQRRKNEELCLDNDQLRREIETLRSRQPAAVGAASAWEPFEALLQSSPSADVTGGDKLVMPAKYFLFGQTKAFMDGLPGMLTGGLLRSMAEEARDNEQGKWLAEFEYVVHREAVEDVPDLATTAKFKGKLSSSGNTIVRDHGHGGMTLADFCSHEMARAAELTVAEVAALRLYSGPMYAPLNYALRTENISDWATTIGCCYSGVLKLSFLSQPARVYRGVKEDEMQLPDEFLSREEGKFAGGVERAFMSTTKSAAVALDYSGGGAASGSIFVIDFDMNSRGASIQFLSQYPHEAELLFPPCTGLGCLDVSEHGRKRCVLVSAQVSTARLDTREVATPAHVPGTEAALQWAAEVLFDKCSVEEVIGKEEWNLRGRNLSTVENAERLALLLGRAATVAAPRVRVVDLWKSQLSPAGVVAIGKALKVNGVLTSLDLGFNDLTEEAALGIVRVERQRNKLTSLGLGQPDTYSALGISPTGAAEIAEYVSGSEVLTKLNLDGHELDLPKLRGTDPVAFLDLSRKVLGPASAIVIASLIAGNEVLTNLDVRRNAISGEAAQQLATAVLASPSLELFDSVPLKELRKNTLDQLDLSDESLGVLEALVLAKLVEGSEALKVLNLRVNSIGPTGATAIADALKVNGVLTDLNLFNTKIGPEGGVAIGKALAVNEVLTNLNLGLNQIGDEGAKALASCLRVNAVVTELDISWNQIGPTGATAIADALRVNGVLKSINLDYTNLGNDGKGVIRDAVSGRVGFELKM